MLLEQSNEYDEIGKMINALKSLAEDLNRNHLFARRLKFDGIIKTLVTNLGCDGIAWTLSAPGYGPVVRMEIIYGFHAAHIIRMMLADQNGIFFMEFCSLFRSFLFTD